MVKKRDRLIIVNKYEEVNMIDAGSVVEAVFKMFYDLQLTKRKSV